MPPTVAEIGQSLFSPDSTDGADPRSGSDRNSATHTYWKRPDGSIVLDQYSANSIEPNTRRQWRKLNYGDFHLADRINGITPRTDLFAVILENGGIGEFEAAQIIEIGWHRRPHPVLERAIRRLALQGISRQEAILQIMPQLVGIELEKHVCAFCMDRVFNYDRNLRSHEIVMHRDEVRGREINRAITGSLAANAEGQAATVEPLLKMLAEAAVQNSTIMPALQKLLEQAAAKGSTPSK